MKSLSDSHHFRKMIAGMCMVAAPLLVLASQVVSPELKTDEGAQLGIVADHLDAWFLSNLLGFFGIVLFVPVVLGLMHMLRERQVAYGHVGGGLTLIGLLAATLGVGVSLVIWQMAQGGADTAQMTALYQRVNDATGTMTLFYVLPFTIAAGMVVLALGLYRARAVQNWMAGCIALGAIAINVGFAVASVTLTIVGSAIVFVGLASIGRMVLAESDEDWEHTPEYKGFRPLAGMR
jgi:hypothetical protein